VFRKDVRQWPWQVFVYFVVVSVTVLRAEDRFGLAGIASGVMMMVTTLFGMVFVTMVVQSDSPTRPNAFWGTRPFHSSALLAAKLGFAVVIVIGMAAAGQVIALTGWNVPATTVVRVTLGGAFAYLMWLFAAMTIAALTRDLRSAIVAFLCMLVGVSVVMGIASNPIVTGASARMVHGWGSAIARVLGVAVPVALLAFLYRRRDVRYRAWVAAAVVFVLFFIAAFDTVPSEADARPTGPAVRLRATLSTSPVLREVHVRLSAIDAPANQRLSFFVDSSVVHLSNGTSLHAAGGQRPPVTVHPAMLPTPGAIRWLGDSRNGQYVTEAVLPLTPQQSHVAAIGVVSADVWGKLYVAVPGELADLPLAAGASVARDGTRIRIAQVDVEPDAASADIVTSYLADAATGLAEGPLTYTMVSPRFGEGTLTEQRNSSGGSGSMVLPASVARSDSTRFEAVTPREDRGITMAPGWFTGARLVVFQWKSLGHYSTRVSTTP